MTQEYLGSLVNFTNAWVSNVETGQLCPRKESVLELEKVLGLPEKVLLDIHDLIKYEEPHPVYAFERYCRRGEPTRRSFASTTRSSFPGCCRRRSTRVH